MYASGLRQRATSASKRRNMIKTTNWNVQEYFWWQRKRSLLHSI